MRTDGVGAAVRTARLEAALTQRDLARRAGLSVGALRDLEQGRSTRPRTESLVALARALGLPSAGAFEDADVVPEPPAARPPVRSPVVIRVLGPLALLGSDGWRAVEGRGQSLTLGALALHVGEDVSHGALVDLLWPDGPPATAVALLRSYVARLRRRVTPLGLDIVSSPGRYRLVAPVDASDVSRFRAEVRTADAAADAEHETDAWCDALELWPASPPTDLPELRGLSRAVGLEQERVRAVVRCAAAAVRCGRPDRAVAHVVALTEDDPLDESVAAAAIGVLAASGRMADVHAVHTRTRRALAEELGLDPGPELGEAFRAALRRTATDRPATDRPATDRPATAPLTTAPLTAAPLTTAPVAAAPHPAEPRIDAPPAPAQLPRTLPVVHGRTTETADAVRLLTAAPGAAPRVVVVSGMGGLGKTTLGVAVAHAVAGRYPDGQLFTDLDGVGEPLSPASVLEHFLVSLGHERATLPGDLERLVTTFRTATAAARYLVVLDNAADAEQVEALLPAGPGCGVLITSRRSLTDLDGAAHIPLGVLPTADALELLAAGVGSDRVGAEVAASAQIVALCSGLPLALRLVVARLTANPSWRMADVAAMLGDEHGRLDVLRSGSRAVRATFELGHRDLPPATARVFRVAAVVPGVTFTAAAVAAALGDTALGDTALGDTALGDTALGDAAPDDAASEEVAVRGVLDDLVDRALLGDAAGGRYRFHDLLRAFADEQGRAHAADHRQARSAVLHWLERTAREATGRVFPHRVGAVAVPGPVRSPDLDDPRVRAAAAWLDAELETLVAAVPVAAVDHPDLAWRLADATTGALRRASTSQEFEQVARAGLAAAEAAGDPRGAGLMCELLARAHVARYDHASALTWFGRARDAAVATGWATFEVSVRENLGISLLVLGRHAAATAEFETALRLAGVTGQRYWEAACLNDLGNVAVLRGRIAAAKTWYRAALAMNDELADAVGRFVNRTNLANAERLAGRPEVAWEHVVGALEGPHATVDRVSFVEGRIVQAEIALDLGRPAEAADLAPRATTWAMQLEQPALAARAQLVLARAHLAAGEVGVADRIARGALATARRVRVPEFALDAHLVLAATALRAGDPAASRRQAAAAARLAAHLDTLAGSGEAGLARARVLLAEGEVEAAHDEVVQAESAFRACGHGRGLAEIAALGAQLGLTDAASTATAR